MKVTTNECGKPETNITIMVFSPDDSEEKIHRVSTDDCSGGIITVKATPVSGVVELPDSVLSVKGVIFNGTMVSLSE